MTRFPSTARLLFAGIASLALVQPARAESDPRKIICAKPCTLVMKACNGSIDIKVPTASASLKTLYQAGDSFDLEGGKEYVLKLNESRDGWFSFDLQFTPKGGKSTWSCTVKTIAKEPFISLEKAVWSGPAGKVTINTDRKKPFITLNSAS